MIWQNIIVDKFLPTQKISEILSRMLPIIPSEILFEEDPYDLTETVPPPKVIVTYGAMRGEFLQYLDINIVDPELRKKHESQPDEEFFQEFCRLANCSCLLPDEDLNPWTYTLIKPNGEMHSVEIEAEDEEDEDLVELMPQFKHLID